MSAATASVQRIPPRGRWAKRLAIAAAAAAVLLAGVRVYWGMYAERVLSDRRAAAHARSEPFDAIDLQPPDVPSGQNAVDVYIAAAGAITSSGPDSPASSAFEFPDGPPFNARWWRMAKAAHDAHAPAHAAIHAADSMTAIDWHVNYATPFAPGSFGPLNTMRNLANSLADAAMYDHLIGDDVASLTKIHDLLTLSARLDRHGTLIGRLVSIGIQALALNRLIMIAPGLSLADGERAATRPVRRASRGDIQQLIAELVDLSGQQASAQHALRGDRALSFSTVQDLTKSSFFLRPYHLLAPEAGVDDALAGLKRLPAPPAKVTGSGGPARSLSQSPLRYAVVGSLSRYVVTETRVMQERGFAAVSLAMQLYRLDHAGRWPAKIDELYPAYLSAVPIDLLSPNSATLKYQMFGDRPMIWSVGENGTDDTHALADLPSGPAYGYYNYVIPSRRPTQANYTFGTTDDQARDLSRIVPAGASTRPVDLRPMSPYAEHERSHEELGERH